MALNGQGPAAAPWRPAGRMLHVNDDPEYLRVELNVKDGRGDDAYLYTSFYSQSQESFTLDDIFTVNERFAASLSYLTNTVVIMVFLRVLCLKRLTSQLLVSLCLGNTASTTLHMVHSFMAPTFMAENASQECSLTYSLAVTSWILIWTILSLAVTERIIAINMPMYYKATHSLITWICNMSPWVYYIILVLAGLMGVFEHDVDYGCSNHLMYTPLEPSRMIIQLLTFIILILMIVVLIMSRVLHPVYADDSLETNRIKLEMKTTYVILRVAVVHVVFFLPLVVYSALAYYNDVQSTYELKVTLVLYQLAIHGNSIPFFVMLGRKEFRRSVGLIFASSAAIRKARPMNLILEATEPWSKKSSEVDPADPMSFTALYGLVARDDFNVKKTANSSSSHGSLQRRPT
ncbi:hypothetical protein Btru_072223 [Bulinus truncatus]|nr:hypothetical protein Btru_072223 [Bulinus truncatus]